LLQKKREKHNTINKGVSFVIISPNKNKIINAIKNKNKNKNKRVRQQNYLVKFCRT
jgi:hypothetical protein